MSFRILVTGSRGWTDDQAIVDAMLDLKNWHPFVWEDVVIVHGACPTGADYLVNLWANNVGIKTEKHPADWKKYGRAAGPKRNQQMVDLGADVVLAFRNPGSRGTQDCINRAIKAGLNVKIYEGE